MSDDKPYVSGLSFTVNYPLVQKMLDAQMRKIEAFDRIADAADKAHGAADLAEVVYAQIEHVLNPTPKES